jgi:hypothetical protein
VSSRSILWTVAGAWAAINAAALAYLLAMSIAPRRGRGSRQVAPAPEPAPRPAAGEERFGEPPSLATLLVSYEVDALASQFADYEGFIAALQGYPQHAPLHHGAWVIRTFDDAQRVSGDLEAFLRPEGRLFVARLGREAAWTDVACGSSWLYENLWS